MRLLSWFLYVLCALFGCYLEWISWQSFDQQKLHSEKLFQVKRFLWALLRCFQRLFFCLIDFVQTDFISDLIGAKPLVFVNSKTSVGGGWLFLCNSRWCAEVDVGSENVDSLSVFVCSFNICLRMVLHDYLEHDCYWLISSSESSYFDLCLCLKI